MLFFFIGLLLQVPGQVNLYAQRLATSFRQIPHLRVLIISVLALLVAAVPLIELAPVAWHFTHRLYSHEVIKSVSTTVYPPLTIFYHAIERLLPNDFDMEHPISSTIFPEPFAIIAEPSSVTPDIPYPYYLYDNPYAMIGVRPPNHNRVTTHEAQHWKRRQAERATKNIAKAIRLRKARYHPDKAKMLGWSPELAQHISLRYNAALASIKRDMRRVYTEIEVESLGDSSIRSLQGYKTIKECTVDCSFGEWIWDWATRNGYHDSLPTLQKLLKDTGFQTDAAELSHERLDRSYIAHATSQSDTITWFQRLTQGPNSTSASSSLRKPSWNTMLEAVSPHCKCRQAQIADDWIARLDTQVRAVESRVHNWLGERGFVPHWWIDGPNPWGK